MRVLSVKVNLFHLAAILYSKYISCVHSIHVYFRVPCCFSVASCIARSFTPGDEYSLSIYYSKDWSAKVLQCYG